MYTHDIRTIWKLIIINVPMVISWTFLVTPHSLGVLVSIEGRIAVGVDGKPGTQSMKVPGHTIGLLHDGWKAYLYIERPTDDDMDKYPIVELTSPMKYEPQKRYQTRRVKSF